MSLSLSSTSISSSTASKLISRSLSLVSASARSILTSPQNRYLHRPYRLQHLTKNPHSIGYPSRNFENSLCLSNSPKLRTKDITGNSVLSRKHGYKFQESFVTSSNRRDLISKTCLFTGRSGVALLKKKERVLLGGLGPSG